MLLKFVNIHFNLLYNTFYLSSQIIRVEAGIEQSTGSFQFWAVHGEEIIPASKWTEKGVKDSWLRQIMLLASLD
jgi:hypothetical protein